MVPKSEVDAFINKPEDGFICEHCLKLYYSEEISRHKGDIHVYHGDCPVCGEESHRSSLSYWRKLIYFSKTMPEIVAIFSEQSAKNLYWTVQPSNISERAASFNELLERSKKNFHLIHYHLKSYTLPMIPMSNAETAERDMKSGWVALFKAIAQQNNLAMPEFEEDFDEWMRWIPIILKSTSPLLPKKGT